MYIYAILYIFKSSVHRCLGCIWTYVVLGLILYIYIVCVFQNTVRDASLNWCKLFAYNFLM